MNLRKAAIGLGLTLTIFLIAYSVIDNRDRGKVFLERIDPNTYVTTDLEKLIYLNSLVSDTNTNYLNFMKETPTYECLNGKDPSTMSPKEQLLEFIQGPCLPVVAVPGLLATRLTVTIDCETFQANNPEIFKACGWTTCTGWKLWNSMPKEEYTLWISDFLGPVSILFHNTVQCWGNIIQLNYNETETDFGKKYSSPIGSTVKIYGQTDSQKPKYNCGFGAVNNILPTPYQTLYSKGFEGIQKSLLNMGHQTGLTLYSTPYDWRKTTMANGVSHVIEQTVKQIYELTGKPTVLMAHSLGNFGALHFLNSLTAEEKEKYIANYVSITNPLAGAPKALKTFIGGDHDYVYKKFGINYYAQKMLIKGSSGAFDLMPKNTYSSFAEEDWLKEWKVRTDLENKNDVNTPEGRAVWENAVKNGDYGYKWFPHPLLNCSFGFEQRRDECGLYMYNWSSIPIAVIQEDSFTASESQLRGLFDKYVLSTNYSNQLFDDVKSNNIYELRNPEVPTTIIYGSHLSTDMTYKWDYDPRNLTGNNQFGFSNITFFSQGDQTVPTSSALLPALKWSWEFDNKAKANTPNAKPVKTVEICSIYNNKGDIYDKKSSDGPSTVETNEYIGLQCDCFDDKNTHPVLGQNCDHSDILNDSKFLDLIKNIVNANFRVTDTSNLIVNQLDDQELQALSNDCPSVGQQINSFMALLTRSKDQPSVSPSSEEEIISM